VDRDPEISGSSEVILEPVAQLASAQRALAWRVERMKSSTYVLKSLKDNRLYIGSTENLLRRISEHNSGKNQSTKNRRPLILVYHEEFETIKEARIRERLFKKSHGILYKAAGWLDKHK